MKKYFEFLKTCFPMNFTKYPRLSGASTNISVDRGAETSWAWIVHKFGDFQEQLISNIQFLYNFDWYTMKEKSEMKIVQAALVHCVRVHDEYCGCQHNPHQLNQVKINIILTKKSTNFMLGTIRLEDDQWFWENLEEETQWLLSSIKLKLQGISLIL